MIVYKFKIATKLSKNEIITNIVNGNCGSSRIHKSVFIIEELYENQLILGYNTNIWTKTESSHKYHLEIDKSSFSINVQINYNISSLVFISLLPISLSIFNLIYPSSFIMWVLVLILIIPLAFVAITDVYEAKHQIKCLSILLQNDFDFKK